MNDLFPLCEAGQAFRIFSTKGWECFLDKFNATKSYLCAKSWAWDICLVIGENGCFGELQRIYPAWMCPSFAVTTEHTAWGRD